MAKYDKWLQDVVDAAQEVMESLGHPEHLEGVFEEALCHELRLRGIPYERQRSFEIMYKGYTVGGGRLDFIINPFWATKGKAEEHVMEIKANKTIAKDHIRQALVYMISLKIDTGAVMSFSPEGEILVEPLSLEKAKKLDWKVTKPKSKKPSELKTVLKKVLNNVHNYFGLEFMYNKGLAKEMYNRAIGVELHLNKIDYNNADYPILYKTQEVSSLPIPFIFDKNSAMVVEFYSKDEEIEENKEYYTYYAKLYGFKKFWIALIPQKADMKIVFGDV